MAVWNSDGDAFNEDHTAADTAAVLEAALCCRYREGNTSELCRTRSCNHGVYCEAMMRSKSYHVEAHVQVLTVDGTLGGGETTTQQVNTG